MLLNLEKDLVLDMKIKKINEWDEFEDSTPVEKLHNDIFGDKTTDVKGRPSCKIDNNIINLAGLNNLKAQVDEYIKQHEDYEVWDDDLADMEHYMFESVLTTFYGKDIWKYLKELRKNM